MAVAGFADRIAWPHAPRQCMADAFDLIGKAEAAEGRSLEMLEMLEAALRAGARVVMHWLTSAAQQAVIPAEMLGLLAEALLIHIDIIAALSATGYERVQARAAEETAHRRHRLVTLLLTEPAPADAIAAQASLAHRRLPALLSVVVLDGHDGMPGRFPALPGEMLADMDRPQPCVIVPDPSGPGRRQMLDRALAGCRAAAGPPVPVSAAAASLHWATEALALVSGRTVPGNRLVYCDDYLTEMVLHRGEDVLGRLTGLRLAPLSHVAMPRRKALAETLLAWLQTRSIGQTGRGCTFIRRRRGTG